MKIFGMKIRPMTEEKWRNKHKKCNLLLINEISQEGNLKTEWRFIKCQQHNEIFVKDCL